MPGEASGAEFQASVELQFENLEVLSKELNDALVAAMKSGLTMSTAMEERFDSMRNAVAELWKFLSNASDEADFQKAQIAMSLISKEASAIGQKLARTPNIPILDASRMQLAAANMKQFNRGIEEMNNKVIKTSLASQNVLRIIQDAPFGMFGIANNLEQMAESMGRLIKETGSVRQALKLSFMPLVTGPMALPLLVSLITMFTLSWDRLAGMIDKARVALGFMTDAQRDFNDAKREFDKSFVETTINQVPFDEIALTIHNAEENLVTAEEALHSFYEAFREEHGMSFEQAKNAADVMRTQSATGFGPESLAPDVLAAAQIYNNSKAKLAELQRDRDIITEALERLRGRDVMEFMKQRTRVLLGLDPFEDEGDKPKKAKKQESLEFRAIQLRIDAMKDGVAKTIAQIKLNSAKEREEIIEVFGERADLLQLLEDKEAAEITAAMEDNHKKVMEERQEEFEEQKKFEEEAAKELLDARMEAIKERAKIGMFGVDRALSEAMAGINRNDPFSQEVLQARSEMDADMNAISVRREEIAAELAAGVLDQKLANAELAKLGAEEIAIRKKTADKVQEIEEQKRAVVRAVFAGMASDISSFFGSLNILSAREGEKGLEENKKFLMAQAIMDAISAGIAATEAILQMKGVPAPIRIAAAFTAGAKITSDLMAKARQIGQIGKGSSGASSEAPTGQWIQLNSAVTGQRVTAFERQQTLDRNVAGTGSVVSGSMDDLSHKFDKLADRIENSMVMYDDRTAGHIVQVGSFHNKRLTGHSDAGS